MRSVNELLSDGLAVIDAAFEVDPSAVMLPLFSGGHDSTCAVYVASQHPAFSGTVHHINTGIGSMRTRRHVEETCVALEWKLEVWRSKSTYEMYIRNYGFPGPGSHHWVYARLKERCVRMMEKPHARVILVTGCRKHESVRRMGNTEAVKVGETNLKGKTTNLKRIWIAPCHDWSSDEQALFMREMALPENPVKKTPIGMSGECFCGAFARPGELEMIRRICPDVAEEIDRLVLVAEEAGKPRRWGRRPRRFTKNQLEFAFSGPLCNSCDARADAANFCLEIR
jgi:3'-phosphoadenosine 5'-phosphosulfate sulfotransferase (PAPS reductase)/FAD synthetase